MEELKSKIAKLKAGINNTATPPNLKPTMQAQLSKLEEQLSAKEAEEAAKADIKKEKEPAKAEPKKEEPAATDKPKKKMGRPKKDKTEAAPKPKKEKRLFKKADRPAEPKHKEGEPSCDELLEKYNKRRASAKKAGKRYKTVSISEKIGDNIASAITKAIHNTPLTDIKEKPEQYIAKFKKVKTYVSDFAKGLKTLLGSDFDKDEIMKPFEEVVEKFIAQIEKKYID